MTAYFNGERVLITGGSGFIGTCLGERLRSVDAEIHAVSRRAAVDDGSGIRRWSADLSHADEVKVLFERVRPHVVYHLASEVTGAREIANVLPLLHSNLVAAVNVLAVATEHGCRRLVLAGSQEEPDGNDQKAIPVSPYAAAKWAASAYSRMFHALYGTPVAIARIYMVYGPGQRDLRKLIPDVITSLLRKHSPRITSGQRPVDWVYVKDVVEGLVAMGTRPGIEGETIELGSGHLTTVREVVEALTQLIGNGVAPQFGALTERPMEAVRRADPQVALARIGWKPTVSLEQGLRMTVEWYKAQPAPRPLAPAS